MSDSFTIFVRRLFFTIITVLWVSEFVSAMDPDGTTSRPLNTTGARFNEQQAHNQQITPPPIHIVTHPLILMSAITIFLLLIHGTEPITAGIGI